MPAPATPAQTGQLVVQCGSARFVAWLRRAAVRIEAMQVIVNGSPQPIPEGTTVSLLLEQMALAGKRVAVERNGEIVPRSLHAQARLADGDRLEIVVAVGGG